MAEIVEQEIPDELSEEVLDSPDPKLCVTIFLLIQYLRYTTSFELKEFFEDESKLTDEVNRDKFNYARDNSVGPTINPELYQHLKEVLYRHITDKRGRYRRLRLIDDRVISFIHDVFPSLRNGVLTAQDHVESEFEYDQLREMIGPLTRIANGSRAKLDRLYENFKNGAYTIRTARNEEEDRKITKGGAPKFAKGLLRILPEHHYKHLKFELTYKSDQSPSVGISGNVYIIGDSLVFVGCEADDEDAFFMIISNYSKVNKNGGLIIRRHQNRDVRRYFSSKVMVYRIPEGEEFDETNGLLDREEIKSYVPNEELEGLLNDVGNSGFSILFKPSFR